MKKPVTLSLFLFLGLGFLQAQQGQPQAVPPAQPYQAVQPANAQAQQDFRFQFGIKLAPNISWMKPTADEYTKDGSVAGITFGLTGEYRFTDNYAIAFGFNSVSTGGKLLVTKDIDANNLAVNVSTTYKLRYIEIPVMLKMMTNDINHFQYYFQTGLGTNFLYRTHGEEEFGGTTKSVDLTDEVNFMKEAFLIGIGAQTKISGNTKIFGGLLYNNGFTDVLSGKDDVTVNGTKKTFNSAAINNYFELNVGILL